MASITVQTATWPPPVDAARLERLAQAINAAGHAVKVAERPKQVERPPISHGADYLDVLIYIGSGMGGAALTLLTQDLYRVTKNWFRKEQRKPDAPKSEQGFLRFSIMDPDGQILRCWQMDDVGTKVGIEFGLTLGRGVNDPVRNGEPTGLIEDDDGRPSDGDGTPWKAP
ncbi:hypothetical protein [Georgenia satyanarayanai]|uniref:hypothetical protein n=1 Tax=Georgenia satyanarayanai TaxID=860221 RepID=UPI001264B13B|nr:hypothetical protein [Georgenia satyanarayanai]